MEQEQSITEFIAFAVIKSPRVIFSLCFCTNVPLLYCDEYGDRSNLCVLKDRQQYDELASLFRQDSRLRQLRTEGEEFESAFEHADASYGIYDCGCAWITARLDHLMDLGDASRTEIVISTIGEVEFEPTPNREEYANAPKTRDELHHDPRWPSSLMPPVLTTRQICAKIIERWMSTLNK